MPGSAEPITSARPACASKRSSAAATSRNNPTPSTLAGAASSRSTPTRWPSSKAMSALGAAVVVITIGSQRDELLDSPRLELAHGPLRYHAALAEGHEA